MRVSQTKVSQKESFSGKIVFIIFIEFLEELLSKIALLIPKSQRKETKGARIF